MFTESGQDTRACLLNQQLHDLRTLRTNMKPWLAFLVGILFLILGVLVIHGMFGILMAVLGVAGLLAGVTALVKRSTLDRQIAEIERQMEAL